jgi:TonB family protein
MLIVSAILPLVQLPVINTAGAEGITQFINAVTVRSGNAVDTDAIWNGQIPMIALIYRIVAFLFIVNLGYQLIRIIHVVFKQGSIRLGGYRLISLPRKAQTFSFFNLVFISSSTPQEGENNQVLKHELAHARQLHSLDIILVQVVKIFQWFNPFIYLTEKALQETHEYLADEAVLEQDGESGRYRLLLITQVFGVQPGIFSFFNYSLIKNRLTMMTKEKSPLRNRFKYLAAIPLIVLLTFLMGSTMVKSQEPVQSKQEIKPKTVEIIAGNEDETITDDEPAFVFVEEQALFQGGNLENFREWVQNNLVYPPDAVKNGIFGRITIQFAVNSKGKVCDVKILRGVDPLLDKEAFRVLNLSPEWKPAKQRGKFVKQQFVMPIIFALQ